MKTATFACAFAVSAVAFGQTAGQVRELSCKAYSVTEPVPEIVLDAKWAPAKMKALGTAGLTAVDKHPGSYMFLAVAEPFTRRGVVCGWVTSEKASGVVKSTVRDGRIVLQPFLEGGKDPADREILFCREFDDCRLGLEAYADEVAKRHGVKLPKQISGYCTWYADRHGGAGDEKSTAEFAAVAEKALKPWGFDFFQIDDQWQLGKSDNGPHKNFNGHRPNGPYPHGMKATAKDLAARGFRPGLWFMPFAGSQRDPFFADKQGWFIHAKADSKGPWHPVKAGAPVETMWGGTCFDATDKDYQAYLRQMVSRIAKEWGYKYFKYDGMWMATGCANIYVNDGYRANDNLTNGVFDDPAETAIGAYRRGVKLMREAAGGDVFILACNVSQNMRAMGASYGLVDACRIGPDNGPSWKGICTGPIRGSARYFYNGRVWYNDPDPVYVRDAIPLGRARANATWVAISGSLFAFSDWLPGLSPERVDVLRRTLAPHRLYAETRPVDLFETPGVANAWLVRKGDVRVFGLFNWDEKAPLKVDYPAAYAGLDPARTYVGFDFWGKAFVPPFKGALKAELPAASCRVLAVREFDGTRPVLVSTSRHVASPAFDVRSEKWDAAAKTLSGVSSVVAGEPYELRFALPEGWTCADGETAGATARVRLAPKASGDFAWSVRFAAAPGKAK